MALLMPEMSLLEREPRREAAPAATATAEPTVTDRLSDTATSAGKHLGEAGPQSSLRWIVLDLRRGSGRFEVACAGLPGHVSLLGTVDILAP